MAKKLNIYTGDSGGYSPPAYYKEMKLASVDINCEESLEKWETILNLSRPQILNAVKEFGPVVRDIRAGLLKRDQDEAA